MTYPDPKPGLVINYGFLWKGEAEKGQEEAEKPHPCVIVGQRETEEGQTMVSVMPITHSPPENNVSAIELPSRMKTHLGLDDKRQWLKTHEVNRFEWPGADIVPIGGGPQKGQYHYGQMPNAVILEARKQAVEHKQNRQFSQTGRDFDPKTEMDKFRQEMETRPSTKPSRPSIPSKSIDRDDDRER